MLGKIKNISLLKSFSGYTTVNLINAGVPFLLQLVLTNYLSTEDYGVLSNLNTFFLLIVPFIGLNVSAAVSRQYVEKDVNLSKYIGGALQLVFLSSVLCFLLLLLIGGKLSEWLYVPKVYLLLVVGYALFHNIIELLLTLLRMEEKTLQFGIFKILRTVLEVGLSLLLVVYLGKDWEGRFQSILFVTVLAGVTAFVMLLNKQYIKWSFYKPYINQFLKFGLPLIPHSISGILIIYSDKIFVTNMVGIEENGIYSVAFQVGMVISLFQNSFNQAWVPYFYKKMTGITHQAKLKLVKFTYLYFILLCLLVFVLWLFIPLIFSLLGSDFKGGADFVLILGLGFAFNGMYKMVVNYIFYEKKTYIISITTIGVATLNMILNYFSIQQYGLKGAAYASCLSFLIEFLVVWIISSRVYPMPWNLFKSH